MLRKFVKSPYIKASIALIVSGSVLIMLSNVLSKTRFTAGMETINKTLMPVYIGVFIAFLLCPIYNKLVRGIYIRLRDSGDISHEALKRPSHMRLAGGRVKAVDDPTVRMKRNLAIAKIGASAISIMIIVAFFALIGYFVIPQIVMSIVNLMNTMPQRLAYFSSWSEHHLQSFPQIVKWINEAANAGTSEIIDWIRDNILKDNFQNLANLVSAQIISVVRGSANLFVGILISIYLLNYKEIIFANTRKIVAATCSEQRSRSLYEFVKIINETFIGFIVGRILDAIIIGILTYVCLLVLNMPLALLIAVIVGVTNVIPFFGPFLGAIPSVCLLMLEDPVKAGYFIVMIFVIQQLDGNVIGPKIVGSAIGIGSFWVLIAVLIGGGLFGFLGMALGVPVFAVFYRYAGKLTNNKLRKRSKETDIRSYTDYAKFGIEEKDLYGENHATEKLNKDKPNR